MAIKEIKDFEMNIKNADGSYDILHPITKAKNVLFSSGGSVEDELSVEKGVWTPSLGPEHAYSKREGHYYKVGNLIIASFYVSMSRKGSNLSGAAKIIDLPFVAKGVFAPSFARISGISIREGDTQITGYCINDYIQLQSNAADKRSGAIPATNVSDSTLVEGTIIYYTEG